MKDLEHRKETLGFYFYFVEIQLPRGRACKDRASDYCAACSKTIPRDMISTYNLIIHEGGWVCPETLCQPFYPNNCLVETNDFMMDGWSLSLGLQSSQDNTNNLSFEEPLSLLKQLYNRSMALVVCGSKPVLQKMTSYILFKNWNCCLWASVKPAHFYNRNSQCFNSK